MLKKDVWTEKKGLSPEYQKWTYQIHLGWGGIKNMHLLPWSCTKIKLYKPYENYNRNYSRNYDRNYFPLYCRKRHAWLVLGERWSGGSWVLAEIIWKERKRWSAPHPPTLADLAHDFTLVTPNFLERIIRQSTTFMVSGVLLCNRSNAMLHRVTICNPL